MFNRRQTLGLLAGSAILGMPGVSFAALSGDRRLVFVILRGAMDGLGAAPPWRDPHYAERRGALALEAPGSADGVLDLDGFFGLHPALAPLHARYRQNEMILFHAVATPYRDRSHFDAQDLLENGTTRPRGATDGWLNRALGLMGGGDGRIGLAVGSQVPLLLRGTVPVGSWAPTALPETPPDFMQKVAALWQRDPLLHPALAEGMRAQAMSDDVLGDDKKTMKGGGGRNAPLASYTEAVGRLLAAAEGPRVAVIESGGWDTHSAQGKLTGRLAGNLGGLAQGLEALAKGLGPAWEKTVVLCMTEFGRTVTVNGTGGTDHGTGSAAFMLGGAVRGGRVMADWPGLAAQNLYQGRDLQPTLDARRILKAVLRDHLGLDGRAIDRAVLPGSDGAAPLDGLFRA